MGREPTSGPALRTPPLTTPLKSPPAPACPSSPVKARARREASSPPLLFDKPMPLFSFCSPCRLHPGRAQEILGDLAERSYALACKHQDRHGDRGRGGLRAISEDFTAPAHRARDAGRAGWRGRGAGGARGPGARRRPTRGPGSRRAAAQPPLCRGSSAADRELPRATFAKTTPPRRGGMASWTRAPGPDRAPVGRPRPGRGGRPRTAPWPSPAPRAASTNCFRIPDEEDDDGEDDEAEDGTAVPPPGPRRAEPMAPRDGSSPTTTGEPTAAGGLRLSRGDHERHENTRSRAAPRRRPACAFVFSCLSWFKAAPAAEVLP